MINNGVSKDKWREFLKKLGCLFGRGMLNVGELTTEFGGLQSNAEFK